MYAPSYSSGDSGLPVSGLSSKNSVQPLSPFLNIDPRVLQAQPEFIFPEGASRQRGRFELAFSQIGGSCIVGAAFGGATGLYGGLKNSTLSGFTGKLRRTQVLNHVMKQGAASANTLGTLAVMYSTFGVILSWARGTDDEANTVAAGTATGMLYKSSAGLRRCAIGGAMGFGLTAAYCMWNARERLENIRSYPNQY